MLSSASNYVLALCWAMCRSENSYRIYKPLRQPCTELLRSISTLNRIENQPSSLILPACVLDEDGCSRMMSHLYRPSVKYSLSFSSMSPAGTPLLICSSDTWYAGWPGIRTCYEHTGIKITNYHSMKVGNNQSSPLMQTREARQDQRHFF